MKKKLISLLLLLLLLANLNVNAVSGCSYKEQANLNSEAAQIKVKYEEKTGLMDPSLYNCGEAGEGCSVEYPMFGITILNMSENFYIEVTSDKGYKEIFTYGSVKDGIITFDHKDVDNVTNYTFNVYSSGKTGCPTEKYRVIHLTTPKLNSYYNSVECNDNSEFYLCQKYLTDDEPRYDSFIKQLTSYEEQKAKEEEKSNRSVLQKIFDFVDNHKALIGVTTTFVVIGVVAVVIVKKRKESI